MCIECLKREEAGKRHVYLTPRWPQSPSGAHVYNMKIVQYQENVNAVSSFCPSGATCL